MSITVVLLFSNCSYLQYIDNIRNIFLDVFAILYFMEIEEYADKHN